MVDGVVTLTRGGEAEVLSRGYGAQITRIASRGRGAKCSSTNSQEVSKICERFADGS